MGHCQAFLWIGNGIYKHIRKKQRKDRRDGEGAGEKRFQPGALDFPGDCAGDTSKKGGRMRNTGLRVGKVSSIDYETGMMQVVYPDKNNEVTARMPYANFNDEYHMPKIGERVLVGHMSNGSSRGVVLCTMWNKKNMPEESGEGIYRKELSKKRGAAYTRFDDGSGEYMVKAPAIQIYGVDRTVLEGSEVGIAANIRTNFESPEHTAILGAVHIAGLEGTDILVSIEGNVKIEMPLSFLEAVLERIKMEAKESVEISAKEMKLKTEESIGMEAADNIRIEDGKFATTLSEIMERLEALDGNRSARK